LPHAFSVIFFTAASRSSSQRFSQASMVVGRGAGAVVEVGAAVVDDAAAVVDVGAAVVSLALPESSPPQAAATRPTESASVTSVRDLTGDLPLRRMRWRSPDERFMNRPARCEAAP
jgi:hypothetical protein